MKILGEIIKDVALVIVGAACGAFALGVMEVTIEMEAPGFVSNMIREAGDRCREN